MHAIFRTAIYAADLDHHGSVSPVGPEHEQRYFCGRIRILLPTYASLSFLNIESDLQITLSVIKHFRKSYFQCALIFNNLKLQNISYLSSMIDIIGTSWYHVPNLVPPRYNWYPLMNWQNATVTTWHKTAVLY